MPVSTHSNSAAHAGYSTRLARAIWTVAALASAVLLATACSAHTAFAAEQLPDRSYVVLSCENPLYGDSDGIVVDEVHIASSDEEGSVESLEILGGSRLGDAAAYASNEELLSGTAETTDASYLTQAQAGEVVRNAMMSSQTSCSFVARISSMATLSLTSYMKTVFIYAFLERAGQPFGGDYQRWRYERWSASVTQLGTSGGKTLVQFNVSFVYYTTASEESYVAQRVADIVNSLGLSGLSNYDKAAVLHDWVVKNVAYDYTHLSDTSYKYQYTAYAALAYGRSVCQGFSTLYYALCRQAGLSTRVIAGIANGGAHSWNIVKLDNNLFYNVDCTWDRNYSCNDRYGGTLYTVSRNYFIKGESEFSDHTPYNSTNRTNSSVIDYSTAKFRAAWPVSPCAYGSLNSASVSLSFSTAQFNGHAHVPQVTVTYGGYTLTEGVDYYTYIVSRKTGATTSSPVSIGTYSVMVIGQGAYSGAALKTFRVTRRSLTSANMTVKLKSSTVTYNGYVHVPTVVVKRGITTLKQGTDYTVKILRNSTGKYVTKPVAAGKYTVIITGIGKFKGTVKRTFTIKGAPVSSLKLSYTATTYTGAAKTPTTKVTAVVNGKTRTLKSGTDYTVTYLNSKGKVVNKPVVAGTYTVKIVGKGKYRGVLTKKFTIYRRTLTTSMVKLSSTKMAYTGKVAIPTVTVTSPSGRTLTQGISYTVKVTNSKGKVVTGKAKAIGVYKITVTGKGCLKGSITKTFVIAPAKVKNVAVKARSGGFAVTWTSKSSTVATGYQIRWSTTKTFKHYVTRAVKSSSASRYVWRGLGKGKTLYVKVRAYKKLSNGKIVYGKWSTVKRVVTK